MIDFEEACRRVAEVAVPLGTEAVPIDEAWRRVLARPVAARRSAPATAVSAMDGYAVRDSDLQPGSARLRVVGQSFAGGGCCEPLAAGTCVRIFTGAPLPPEADRVVMQETVRRIGDDVLIEGPAPSARHIRPAGSDFAAGERLLEAGRELTPQALVAAAAADVAAVEVFVRPRVAILSTGDELVAPGSAADSTTAIPESVSFGVAALVRQWGGDLVARRRLGDELSALAAAAQMAVETADVVVTTGGASVGERDFSKAMFEPLGLELIFNKAAIKPGKPIWFGQAGGRLVVGLPGNPSAAMVTARLFLAPLLAGMTGRTTSSALEWRTLPLAGAMPAVGQRECFDRGRMTPQGVMPAVSQDSSAQKELAAADLLIRRRPGAPAVAAGEPVEVLVF